MYLGELTIANEINKYYNNQNTNQAIRFTGTAILITQQGKAIKLLLLF